LYLSKEKDNPKESDSHSHHSGCIAGITSTSLPSSSWVIDSYASHHMTGSSSDFHSLDNFSGHSFW
ncbi:hypothetical protein AMTR_s00087p00180720, partial [Amborella trichopoda]